MSFVGPRPLIESEDCQVEGRFRRRLSLTPGLTGLWQAHGRSDIPFEQMVNLDYLYVTNWSLWLDVKLLMRRFGGLARQRRLLIPVVDWHGAARRSGGRVSSDSPFPLASARGAGRRR